MFVILPAVRGKEFSEMVPSAALGPDGGLDYEFGQGFVFLRGRTPIVLYEAIWTKKYIYTQVGQEPDRTLIHSHTNITHHTYFTFLVGQCVLQRRIAVIVLYGLWRELP